MIKKSAAAMAVILTFVSPAFADITQERNFYQFTPNVLTSGQPSADTLATAAEDGIQVVINLVPESEGIYNPDEQSILEAQGIEYIHVPVTWRNPQSEEFNAFIAAMDTVGERTVLVHCWSNARGSAMVTAHRAMQSPQTQDDELARLETIWSDVAGYNFASDEVWQGFLAENLEGASE